MKFNAEEFAAGMIFVAIGSWFAVTAFFNLKMGTVFRMGPGYFPMVLSTLVITLGLLIAIRGMGIKPAGLGRIPWRGIILIGLAPLVLAVCARSLGMFPSVMLSSFLATFASQRMRAVQSLLLSAAIAGACVAIFVYGLHVQIPIFGYLLTFR